MCDANGNPSRPVRRATQRGFTGAEDGIVHLIDYSAIPDAPDSEATLDGDTETDSPEDSP